MRFQVNAVFDATLTTSILSGTIMFFEFWVRI